MGSAPAEFRSDALEDTFDHVGVVVHAHCNRASDAMRTAEDGAGDQCPNERKPIFFTKSHAADHGSP